jgi:hypothetical protein
MDRRAAAAWRAVVAGSVATIGIVLLAGVASPATAGAGPAVDGPPPAFYARPLGLALVACLLASALGIWRGKRRAATLGIGLLCVTLLLDAALLA